MSHLNHAAIFIQDGDKSRSMVIKETPGGGVQGIQMQQVKQNVTLFDGFKYHLRARSGVSRS
jgi:hypothetical protein